jgi:hypothetical protein
MPFMSRGMWSSPLTMDMVMDMVGRVVRRGVDGGAEKKTSFNTDTL